MKIIIDIVLTLLFGFFCFTLARTYIFEKATNLVNDLIEDYNGTSNEEIAFRNGARWLLGKLTDKIIDDYEDITTYDPDEIEAAEIDAVYHLLVSYGHSRSNKEMVSICEELIHRLEDKDAKKKRPFTDEVNVIYGFIVFMFSEYGTKPYSHLIPLIVDQIKAYMNARKTSIEMHKEEQVWLNQYPKK